MEEKKKWLNRADFQKSLVSVSAKNVGLWSLIFRAKLSKPA